MDANTPSPQVALLERMLAAAKDGTLVDVVVVFRTKHEADGVQASPMSVITLNHLWRIFDDRVRSAYREVRQRASSARGPTAGVSVAGPQAKVAAQLPRAVRRAVAKAQRKLAPKAAAPKPPPTAN